MKFTNLVAAVDISLRAQPICSREEGTDQGIRWTNQPIEILRLPQVKVYLDSIDIANKLGSILDQ